jgi:AcrR family transcriptional regulator
MVTSSTSNFASPRDVSDKADYRAKMTAKNYHHGDLRAALIEAGLTLVEESGGDEVALREVARRVGVSATAVYRHFPDKNALMAALAQAGLQRLAEVQRVASDKAGGGIAGFNATGAAYVRFALDNPGLFRLVFAHPPRPEIKGGLRAEDDAMVMLKTAAAALAPAGTDPGIFALQSWSIAHGLAMLMLDGQITLDDAALDRVIDMHGLGGQVPPQ